VVLQDQQAQPVTAVPQVLKAIKVQQVQDQPVLRDLLVIAVPRVLKAIKVQQVQAQQVQLGPQALPVRPVQQVLTVL
jgi:hypothetical protein